MVDYPFSKGSEPQKQSFILGALPSSLNFFSDCAFLQKVIGEMRSALSGGK